MATVCTLLWRRFMSEAAPRDAKRAAPAPAPARSRTATPAPPAARQGERLARASWTKSCSDPLASPPTSAGSTRSMAEVIDGRWRSAGECSQIKLA